MIPKAMRAARVVAAAAGASDSMRRAIAVSIRGRVQDASGAVVVGAAVTAVNEATNETRTTASGDAGAFALAELAPGAWRIEIGAPGHKTHVQRSMLDGESGAARRRAAAARCADRSRRSVGADCRCAARLARRRHRRREPADPRHAARRPEFSRAHAARAGHRARGAGIRRVGARRLFVQRQRRPRRFQQLSARRRRQRRSEAEHDWRAGRRSMRFRSSKCSRARPRPRTAARRRRKSASS